MISSRPERVNGHIRIQTFKVATPAVRAGVKDAKPGDMVYFDEPKLITEGKVTLVVKKHLQRGV